MSAITQWFTSLQGIIPDELIVTLVSMLPLVELRGGIPVARFLQMPLQEAIFFSMLGNILPIPFILLFIRKIFDWMRPTKTFGGLVRKLEKRAMDRSDKVKNAEFWGLVAFVGIPLPGTGGWTGALIAALLDVDIRKALAAILCGMILAATIVGFISYGIFRL
ncbi:MAG: small multi-drug export protein [Lachnospiraceae bacterium]|nr:small multi-drug export protein [Lachnospiraceae bacterium]